MNGDFYEMSRVYLGTETRRMACTLHSTMDACMNGDFHKMSLAYLGTETRKFHAHCIAQWMLA